MTASASTVATTRFGNVSLPDVRSIVWPLAALALVLLMQFELVFSKSINWDEFFHFSLIHRHLLGQPVQWLQTPFVWLYSWVPSLPGDNITHIRIIRALILPFEFATLAAIFAMARYFASRETAALCALAYASGGYVFLHAFALRADMIAAALLMGALWIGLCRPLRPLELAIAGLLVILASVATIKSVLYAPAFFGVLLIRLQTPTQRWIVAGIAALTALALILLLLVGPWLPRMGLAAPLHDVARLGQLSIDRMFSGGLFPQGRSLVRQIIYAPLLAIILILAACLIWKQGRTWQERIILVALLAPLCTVAFYRNAYPYFFVFILPPALVAAAPAIDQFRNRYGLIPLSIAFVLNAFALSYIEDRTMLDRQRTIQTGLREIFPQPVTYIDESGMLSEYPRAVPHFASGWALENYRRAKKPEYSEAMQQEQVPLVIATSHALRNVFAKTDSDLHLLPDDAKTLHDNYIQHWGLAYVAGKRIAAGVEPETIAIAVPGPYTVEDGTLEIDGHSHAPGDVVTLSRGRHIVTGSRRNETVLRWGDHLPHPAFEWPKGRFFTDY
ncbi:hypothetical protein MB02_14880 [Croceicoccus estronivorus]|uniref:hypothetical protein n=1 Tax=Croceicoccus estronivorus TaxID=1172626 RepID=UPI0008327AE2|nr:hypothetical protein [Croceicoccus estronivorus]OCC22706.1 hypothetical protein MB02_14880 [Croceicoccus estronivorus]